jgi:tetratricopeptide (TPR) repeat protein
MELAVTAQHTPAASERISIIVQCGRTAAAHDVDCLIAELRHRNPGCCLEIILLGRKPVGSSAAVNAWIECGDINRKAFLRAAARATGDFIVFMHADMALPKNWLRWLRYYFRWHENAGAVKCLADADDCEKILSAIPPAQRPGAMEDRADYCLSALMGNEVSAAGLDLRRDCIMLSRKALDSLVNTAAFHTGADSVASIGTELTGQGYTLWHAVEVFAYRRSSGVPEETATGCAATAPEPLPQLSVQGETGMLHQAHAEVSLLVEKAKSLTQVKNFREAIPLLEQAKALLSEKNVNESAQDMGHTGRKPDPAPARPDVTPNGSTADIRYLYEEALRFKNSKDYRRAIDMLEAAKRKIA